MSLMQLLHWDKLTLPVAARIVQGFADYLSEADMYSILEDNGYVFCTDVLYVLLKSGLDEYAEGGVAVLDYRVITPYIHLLRNLPALLQ